MSNKVELNAYKKSMESLLSWLEQKHPEIKEQYFTEKKAEAMARFNFD